MVLDGVALAEVLQLEQLADLDLALLVVWIGAALDPRDAFRERLALQDPVAGNQFLGLRERTVDDGALGIGVAELAGGETDARALGDGCRPLPSSMTPAFTISSLNFAMAARPSSEGILPASESLVALTITMKRIVVSPLVRFRSRAEPLLYCHDEPGTAKSTGVGRIFLNPTQDIVL